MPSAAAMPGPVAILRDIAITLLTPFFLPYAGNDLRVARVAAWQALRGHDLANAGDLLPILQILTFGYAAVSSLALSMDDDVPMPLRLGFRANAAALDRAHDRHLRRHHATQRHRAATADTPTAPEVQAPAPPPPATAAAELPLPGAPAAAATPAPITPAPITPAPITAAPASPTTVEPPPASPAPAPQQAPAARPAGLTGAERQVWATILRDVAGEFAADPTALGNSVRARALNSVARDLLAEAPSTQTGYAPAPPRTV